MQVAAHDALVACAVIRGGDIGRALALRLHDARTVDRADRKIRRHPQKARHLIAVFVAQRDLERLPLDAHGDVAVGDRIRAAVCLAA